MAEMAQPTSEMEVDELLPIEGPLNEVLQRIFTAYTTNISDTSEYYDLVLSFMHFVMKTVPCMPTDTDGQRVSSFLNSFRSLLLNCVKVYLEILIGILTIII